MRLRDQLVAYFQENDREGIDPLKLERFTAAQFADYLERHQRSATSLLAVWGLTKDEAILREAFKRFENPLIALHAFQNLGLTKEEKLAAAAKLEQSHPGSPIGAMLSGALLAKDGRSAEAIASEVITYARNFSAEPGHFLVNELLATSLEVGAVHALPPDVEIGDSGLTAAEYVARIRKEVQFDINAKMHHLARLDEAGLETYLQVLESQGDRAALLWAESYNGPAAPGAK